MDINITLNSWEFIVLNIIAPITAGVYYTIKHYLDNKKEKPIVIESKGQKN